MYKKMTESTKAGRLSSLRHGHIWAKIKIKKTRWHLQIFKGFNNALV